jgi:hypothetical protein
MASTAGLVYINVAPLIQVRLFLGVRPPFGAGVRGRGFDDATLWRGRFGR